MKKRFTWLDGVLLAVLAIVIAVGAYLVLKPAEKEEDAETREYLVTMRFNQVSEIENDGYQVGDKLYFQDRVDTLGKIQSVKTIDRQIERFNVNTGEYVLMTDPDQKTVELQVLVEGVLEDGKFTVEEQELFVGRLFYPQSDTTRSGMTIWSIEEVAEK